jgi:hypothetical protein
VKPSSVSSALSAAAGCGTDAPGMLGVGGTPGSGGASGGECDCG